MLSRPLKGVYDRLDRYSILRLVSVVDLLYFILDHVTLGFTFLLIISILAIICTNDIRVDALYTWSLITSRFVTSEHGSLKCYLWPLMNNFILIKI
jgi:hypothetical protein